MSPDKTADFLASLRLEYRSVDELPQEFMPADVAEAYRAQAKLVEILCERWGGTHAGYKVALTNEAAQRMLGVHHPVYGTMISAQVHASGVTLRASDYVTRLIEVEFGFRIGEDVPSADTSWTFDSIGKYVDEAYPAIELVEHHFAGIDRVTPESLVADNAIHGAWIRGKPFANWRSVDLGAQTTRLLANGTETLTGSGNRVLGHPLAPVAWLANELPRHGLALKAGNYVTTGVTTDKIYPAVAGERLVADFPGLGAVELEFSE